MTKTSANTTKTGSKPKALDGKYSKTTTKPTKALLAAKKASASAPVKGYTTTGKLPLVARTSSATVQKSKSPDRKEDSPKTATTLVETSPASAKKLSVPSKGVDGKALLTRDVDMLDGPSEVLELENDTEETTMGTQPEQKHKKMNKKTLDESGDRQELLDALRLMVKKGYMLEENGLSKMKKPELLKCAVKWSTALTYQCLLEVQKERKLEATSLTADEEAIAARLNNANYKQLVRAVKIVEGTGIDRVHSMKKQAIVYTLAKCPQAEKVLTWLDENKEPEEPKE